MANEKLPSQFESNLIQPQFFRVLFHRGSKGANLFCTSASTKALAASNLKIYLGASPLNRLDEGSPGHVKVTKKKFDYAC